MKRVTILMLTIILISGMVYPKAKMNEVLSQKIKTHFTGLEWGVLVQGDLPSQAKGKSIISHDTVSLKVENGGVWKQKSTLGIKDKVTNLLPKGELVAITAFSPTKSGVNLNIETQRGLEFQAEDKYGSTKKKFDQHCIDFEFQFDEQYLTEDTPGNFDFIIGAIEKYLKCFKSEADAIAFSKQGGQESISIKLGMTEAEVVAAMGVPEKKVDLGEKITLVYKDMTIVLTAGKVSDVQVK
jgi:hypothetical protein